LANYPIRPEREAHVLAGVSIGGGSAFHHGIKHKDLFGVVLGVFPPLNVRWMDCHGHYWGQFDPCCWGWRTQYCLGLEPVGKFYHGLVQVPFCRLVRPLYGNGQQVVPQLSRDNPIEMLERYCLGEGELAMLVVYGGKDEFNIHPQVDSFLYRARQLGLTVDCLYDPQGRHNLETAKSFLPAIFDWLSIKIAPFSPGIQCLTVP
jgi:S-formylglutathione hydrolase FrmB